MAYASISDVRSMVSIKTIDGRSDPSIQQAVSMIDDVAAEIDVLLAAKDYDVPIATTATVAWGFLRQLNAYGAAMRVEAAGPKGENSPHLEFLERQYNRRWDQMVSGGLPLAGVEPSTTVGAPRVGGLATSLFTTTDYR